jgi:hypothetical protein
MDQILQEVIKFLLKYANPVVGFVVWFAFEWLKRNAIEKIIALTSQVKKFLYPAMVILMSVGTAQLIKLLRPVVEKFGPAYLVYFPLITNIWIVGGATGILIALGYKYTTKDLPAKN